MGSSSLETFAAPLSRRGGFFCLEPGQPQAVPRCPFEAGTGRPSVRPASHCRIWFGPAHVTWHSFFHSNTEKKGFLPTFKCTLNHPWPLQAQQGAEAGAEFAFRARLTREKRCGSALKGRSRDLSLQSRSKTLPRRLPPCPSSWCAQGAAELFLQLRGQGTGTAQLSCPILVVLI